MHMTSIESGVTVFCNSVLGARSNRDGFFSVYAAIAGGYPRFGYHFDENRVGSHLVRVEAALENVSDFTCLGFHVGKILGSQVPVVTGFTRRPTLDELDGFGAGLATTGSVSMFIIPQITPPFATVEQAFAGRRPVQDLVVRQSDIDAVYDGFDPAGPGDRVDFVHLGCPACLVRGDEGVWAPVRRPDGGNGRRALDHGDRGDRPLRPQARGMNARTIRGRGIVRGTATGTALISPEPISFLGDLDIQTGQVVNSTLTLYGQSVAGRVLVIPYSVGSAGAWRFLYQLSVHGTNPSAIVTQAAPDSSLVQGAILAKVPLVCDLEPARFAALRTGDELTVDGTIGMVTVVAGEARPGRATSRAH
jgi:predicted aconitase with swiveling domain